MKLHRFLPMLGVLTVAFSAGPAARADIAWTTSFQSGIAAARQSNKPIILDFYADWCPPCREMENDTWPNSTVRALSERFVMVKLNADVAQQEVQAYGIDGIPATVFLDSQGRFLGKVSGYQSPDALAANMRRVLSMKTQAANLPKPAPVKRPGEVRVMQGKSVKSVQVTSANWQALPGMEKIASQKTYSGVYLLDENGATRLDAPAKPPVKKAAAKPQAKAKSKAKPKR